MEYTPRELIALLRAGFIEKALKANTIWYCTSCYLCTVRCPMEIRITDMMYALKDFAHREDLHDKTFKAPKLAETFVEVVNNYGRNAEMEFLTRYYLNTNPLAMLGMAPLGMKLLSTGRISLIAKSIKGREEIQAIINKVKSMGGTAK
jgi:heterodisulfide reductase subunit C